MAIGVIFELPGMTQSQYDEVISTFMAGESYEKLKHIGLPGNLLHLAGPTDNGWRIVDVWESKEAFERFAQMLMPTLAQLHMPLIAPQVFPLHRFIKD